MLVRGLCKRSVPGEGDAANAMDCRAKGTGQSFDRTGPLHKLVITLSAVERVVETPTASPRAQTSKAAAPVVRGSLYRSRDRERGFEVAQTT